MPCRGQFWTVACLGTGTTSLAALLLAVATEHWVYLMEQCLIEIPINENGTNITHITAYNFTTISRAGLWKICLEDMDVTNCVDVGLSEGLKRERVDGQWMTGAVTEATRAQFPLPVAAVVLTLSGFIFSILGNYRKDKKMIVSAVLYILSGMCLSIGVIVYISSINDELSHQPMNIKVPIEMGTVKGTRECQSFKYAYDWSFFLIGISFIMEEISAVISVKVYLAPTGKNLENMMKIIPGLEEKLNLGKDRPEGTSHTTLIW
ncbi:hypothetical protein CHS0354_034023 [Potamilus streckersoni]|uniref:Uncharacterized protein n=1 Tax=Potamilus streckersoni TaxID=2493646 RepID=A0AAE0RMP3_9BIVA|nr:hypothetical protein CHS0354_034023 [Potamilus streckersoni]